MDLDYVADLYDFPEEFYSMSVMEFHDFAWLVIYYYTKHPKAVNLCWVEFILKILFCAVHLNYSEDVRFNSLRARFFEDFPSFYVDDTILQIVLCSFDPEQKDVVESTIKLMEKLRHYGICPPILETDREKASSIILKTRKHLLSKTLTTFFPSGIVSPMAFQDSVEAAFPWEEYLSFPRDQELKRRFFAKEKKTRFYDDMMI